MSDHAVIARVVLEKVLTEHDMILNVSTEDESGTELALIDAIGMLALGQHILTAERMQMGESPFTYDDDEGDA